MSIQTVGSVASGTGLNGRQPIGDLERDVHDYIMDQPEQGMFTVDRDVFRDPRVFDLEMQHIFEGSWIYLAHESQLARPHDFFTTSMGRQPVLLMRDKAGQIGAFINACPHRGATVCQLKRGNQRVLTCPYHGWSFNTAGALISVKDHANGAYPAAFEEQSHGLTPIARLANYKGFLFGSLNDDVPALEDHLAAALSVIDMLADQAPDGWEVIAGSADYTYHGNWKLQVENGVDGYHFDVVHRTFVGVVQRRAQSGSDEVQSLDAERLDAPTNATGCYDLGNGHTLLWTDYPNPQVRPSYAQRDALRTQYGEARARWMVERLRNLLLYPNVFLMDQISAQIRVVIPLAVDRTLVSTYCLAPVGEAPETRVHRLRQYEDFFNASGVGTPDDLAAFEACQRGFNGHQVRWQQGYVRGTGRAVSGADDEARSAGLQPVASSSNFQDEIIFQGQYRRWLSLMSQGQGAARGNGHDG